MEAQGGYRIGDGAYYFRKSVKTEEAFKTLGFRRCIRNEARLTDFADAEGAPFLSHSTIMMNLANISLDYTALCDSGLEDDQIVGQGFDPDYLGIRDWHIINQCPIFQHAEFFDPFIRFSRDCFSRIGSVGLHNFLPTNRQLCSNWCDQQWNILMKEALHNVEIAFSICFGFHWNRCMEPVVQIISDYRQKFQNQYLWDLVSRAIGKFIHLIGAEKSKEFPEEFPLRQEGDKTNPVLVRELLLYLLRKNVGAANNESCLRFSTTLQMQQSSSTAGYILTPPLNASYQFSSKSTIGKKSNSAQVVRRTPSSSQVSSRGVSESRGPSNPSDKTKSIVCMMDLLHQNKIKLSFMKGEVLPCRRGDKCQFLHHDAITNWSAGKIWDGIKGSPQVRRANADDVQTIKKAIKLN
jgi:hypothetical protein